MEIDSKPEEMDRLERRLMQLKIEREALKKETDEASRKQLELLSQQIDDSSGSTRTSRRSGKPRRPLQGAAAIKGELEQARSISRRRGGPVI
jgi:ATP-dependent Clp protease ATP-binding subunit ClpB